jgi:hypothetical protein
MFKKLVIFSCQITTIMNISSSLCKCALSVFNSLPILFLITAAAHSLYISLFQERAYTQNGPASYEIILRRNDAQILFVINNLDFMSVVSLQYTSDLCMNYNNIFWTFSLVLLNADV